MNDNAEVSEKECSKCFEVKPLEEFHNQKRGKYGKASYCRFCISRYDKEYQKKNKDKILERKLRYTLGLLGISRESYDLILKRSKNRCEICKKKDVRLCIDHCHSTNKIRGILCHQCNAAIGMLGDTKGTLFKAYKYLEKFG